MNRDEKAIAEKEYELLKNTPRFVPVEVTFFGKKIKAPDSASLLFLNKELFGYEIYKFKANMNCKSRTVTEWI